MRLDQFLVQKKITTSRTQAQELISKGFVSLNQNGMKTVLKKSSFVVDESNSENIIVEENELQKYVSRAGLKLEGVLKALKINVANKIVLDVGQSTGGFSDCLIQSGAQKVVGLDVGHSQLHEKLKNIKNIVSIEGLNAKDLKTDAFFLSQVPENKFDMIVMDVSFISITKVIPHLVEFLRPNGEYLFLVKPQFECGPDYLDKNGLVKDLSIYQQIESNMKKIALNNFNNVEFYIKSDLQGKDGNQEFFIYGKKSV